MQHSSQPNDRVDVFVFAICLSLAFVLLILPDDVQILVADRLGTVLTSPYWRVRNFGEDVVTTAEENVRLKARVAELELAAAAEQRAVQDSLRAGRLLLPDDFRGTLLPCQVVTRQRVRFATMLEIHSLAPARWVPYQPVITAAGVIGRIRRIIDDRTAWVELLVSPGFALGVEIERTGLLGVLRPGAGGFVLDMVGRDEDVQAGDRLVTSGIEEIRGDGTRPDERAVMPRGLPAGTVVAVASPTDAIFKEITVEPAAAFNRNIAVFVVMIDDPRGPANQGNEP